MGIIMIRAMTRKPRPMIRHPEVRPRPLEPGEPRRSALADLRTQNSDLGQARDRWATARLLPRGKQAATAGAVHPPISGSPEIGISSAQVGQGRLARRAKRRAPQDDGAADVL